MRPRTPETELPKPNSENHGAGEPAIISDVFSRRLRISQGVNRNPDPQESKLIALEHLSKQAPVHRSAAYAPGGCGARHAGSAIQPRDGNDRGRAAIGCQEEAGS
jgi:hypothetical protein